MEEAKQEGYNRRNKSPSVSAGDFSLISAEVNQDLTIVYKNPIDSIC